MKDVETTFSGIEFKLKTLIGNYQQLQAENQKSIKEIQELKSEISKQKETIKELEERIKVIKLAKSLELTEGNVEAKLKINELVREIDKCIGLLNT